MEMAVGLEFFGGKDQFLCTLKNAISKKLKEKGIAATGKKLKAIPGGDSLQAFVSDGEVIKEADFARALFHLAIPVNELLDVNIDADNREKWIGKMQEVQGGMLAAFPSADQEASGPADDDDMAAVELIDEELKLFVLFSALDGALD